MRHSISSVATLLAVAAIAATPPVSQVVGDMRILFVQTPAGTGAATMSKLDGSRTGYYWDLGEHAGELRPKAKRVVMLGLGGGEMLRAARRSLPKAELLGVDNDPRMIRAALEEFKIGAFGAKAVQADAFDYVKQLRGVDVLIVDLFVDDVMPPMMLRRSFVRDCRVALAPNGLLMVNVYPAQLVSQVVELLTLEGMGILDDPEVHGSTVLFATPAAAPL